MTSAGEMTSPLPKRRYENKYVIPRELVEPIRSYLSTYCRLDRHVAPGHQSYTVHSLYFDTPTCEFYWDSRSRTRVRKKLRVRCYGEEQSKYIWLEVKRKVDTVVMKDRRRIPFRRWPGCLEGRGADGAPAHTLPARIGGRRR